MPHFRLHHGPANLGAAVGAFISEIDLRHAPMRLDVAHIHRNSDAARTKDEGGFNIVMMDIGWHVGSPQEDTQESISPVVPDPKRSIRLRRAGDHELS